MSHRLHRAAEPADAHVTERAKPLARSVIQAARRALRSRVHHMRWRERIADLIANTLPLRARLAWAAASGESFAFINACATTSEADRKTLRVVDLLFMAPAERAAVMHAIEEWAQAIERGEM